MTLPKHKTRKVTAREAGYKPFELRLWHGISLDVWLRLMRGRWGKVSARRYPLLATITLISVGTFVKKWLVRAIYGRRLAQVQIEPDPIFILGHFRSGTTWLHETLAADPAFCGPSSMACFHPDGFLLGRGLSRAIMALLAPKTRPMDNVTVDVEAMQEDEVGLLMSGAPTPYQSLLLPCEPETAFPPPTTGQMTPAQADEFRQIWTGFLRKIQFCNPGKRLLLKSPLHTVRVDEIVRIFPNAKFIHIVRDPYRIFVSNRKTMSSMLVSQGLQDRIPTDDVLQEQGLANFVRFHDQFDDTRGAIPPGNIVTIRYEDLRADVPGTIRGIYDTLDLGNFEDIADIFEREAEQARTYKTNTFGIDADVVALVDAHWHRYFEQYGYLKAADRPDGVV